MCHSTDSCCCHEATRSYFFGGDCEGVLLKNGQGAEVWKIHVVNGRNNVDSVVNQRPLQLMVFAPITSDIPGEDLATAVQLKFEETGQ